MLQFHDPCFADGKTEREEAELFDLLPNDVELNLVYTFAKVLLTSLSL